MDRFLKRRAGTDARDAKNGKKLKKSVEWGTDDPKTIVAWNCNGLTARIRAGDSGEFKKFIKDTKPDIVFLSEVRVAAANNAASRKPGPNTHFYRNRMKDNDKKSGEDAGGVNELLRCDELSPFVAYFSLANTKYAGTALLIRKESVKKPLSIRYNLDGEETDAKVHDGDGRVIYAEFSGFSLLHTYVPNNGWVDSHFARRKAWDDKILQFVERERSSGKRLMWLGDLNVAPEDADLSHPTTNRRAVGEELRKKAKETGVPIDPCNIGQPGCTDAERNRFSKILAAGDVVDVFRKLYGYDLDKDFAYSWRGLSGSGMRIDHCIASSSLVPRIESAEITGHGVHRLGFMGSDHSPILVKMHEESKAPKPVEQNSEGKTD